MKKLYLVLSVLCLFGMVSCTVNIDKPIDKPIVDQDQDKDKDKDKTPVDEPSPIVVDYNVYKLYITTENNQPITSKEVYLNGTVSVKEGDCRVDSTPMEIRGRGNSTWSFNKKPYRIKMSERIPLLGLKPIKNYVLLAEYTDKSLLRNFLAHTLAKMLNSYYPLDYRYVELYLNNDYQGVYLLTEQVKVDKNGLDGTYLVELEQGEDRIENEGIENKNWFHEGVNLVIKEPDMDKLEPQTVQETVDYLKTFIKNMTLSFKDDYDTYIDVDTFIDYFVLHEIFKTVDVGYSSVYSVIKDDVLYMGPFWDFDISLGNGDYFNSSHELYRNRYNLWFDSIIDNEAFRVKYLKRLTYVLETFMPQLLEHLDLMYTNLKPAALRNFETWPILNEYVWPNPPKMTEQNTYEGQYLYLRSHINNRVNWLLNEIEKRGYYPYQVE